MSKASSFIISDQELEALVSRYTRDLTALDRASAFDPVTGRDEELDWLVLVLLQRLRRNALLLGGAGVGKTALFIGLAQWINAGKVPALLKGARLIEMDMSMLGAGSSSRAELEGRLMPILRGTAERNATRKGPPIIFCIDEIHQLMLPFKGSSYAGVADLMKPYLTAGQLYIVGATTREEYEDYVRVDPAIDRRFQKKMIEAPDAATTLSILLNLKDRFEKHCGLKIPDELCARVVKLAERYIQNRSDPDRSIISLDMACALAIKKGVTGTLDDASVRAAVASEGGIAAEAVK